MKGQGRQGRPDPLPQVPISKPGYFMRKKGSNRQLSLVQLARATADSTIGKSVHARTTGCRRRCAVAEVNPDSRELRLRTSHIQPELSG